MRSLHFSELGLFGLLERDVLLGWTGEFNDKHAFCLEVERFPTNRDELSVREHLEFSIYIWGNMAKTSMASIP